MDLPVYEIYKAGHDLSWQPGLDLFGAYGQKLVFVPHWNNAEGGVELDTSCCFMGRGRFEALAAMLPPDVTVVGIDEHTALAVDLADGAAEVMGAGDVTVLPPTARGPSRPAVASRWPSSARSPGPSPMPACRRESGLRRWLRTKRRGCLPKRPPRCWHWRLSARSPASGVTRLRRRVACSDRGPGLAGSRYTFRPALYADGLGYAMIWDYQDVLGRRLTL